MFASRNSRSTSVEAFGMTARRTRPNPLGSRSSTATITISLPNAPRPPSPACSPPTKVSSTSTVPLSLSWPARTQRRAETVQHRPGRLVRPEAEQPLHLQRGHAVLRAGHVPGRREPHGQRRAGVLEDGPCGPRDAAPAAGAPADPALHLPRDDAPAVRAGKPIGPAQPVEVVKARTLGKGQTRRRLPVTDPDPIALLADARLHLIDAHQQLQAAVIRARQHHTTPPGPPSPACWAPPDKPLNSASPGLDIHRSIDPVTERREPCLCRLGTASARARRPFPLRHGAVFS